MEQASITNTERALNMALIVRLILAAVLLIFVFQETGWATTLAFALLVLISEINTYWLKLALPLKDLY